MTYLLLLLHGQLLIGVVTSLCQSNDFTLLTGDSGLLREPQDGSLYNGNLACTWVINQPDRSEVLYFNISYLDIEQQPQGCWSDHLQIMDYPLLQTFWADLCGTLSSPVLIRGESNAARIRFLTQRPGPENTGFTLQWYFVPVCREGQVPLSGPSGVVEPCNWPGYDGTYYCQWLITVSDDSYVVIQVNEFDTSKSDCDGDYLTVANGEKPEETWAIICSMRDMTLIHGSTKSALITWHRDNEYQPYETFNFYWSENSQKGDVQIITTTGKTGSAETSTQQANTLRPLLDLIVLAAIGLSVMLNVSCGYI